MISTATLHKADTPQRQRDARLTLEQVLGELVADQLVSREDSERLLDLAPTGLHQRVPVVFGSRDEVERIERYHHEHDCGADRPYVSPLFNERSLFRAQELA